MNMNAERAERQLALLYSVSAALSAISIISFTVTWQHWAWTIDLCDDVDCGCILYGISTSSYFKGGDVKLCQFGTYGLVPALVVALCLGIYHGYRVCISRRLEDPQPVSRTATYYNRHRHNGEVVGEVMLVRPKRRSPCKQWLLAAFLAAFICCLLLPHVIVLTDGYLKTCEQYRRNLIKRLDSRGSELQVINDRLSCGSILDYMDYLTPDAHYYRRGNYINTGLALQFSIWASWLNFFTWICIIVINAVMAKRRANELGDEKMCCCC